MSYQIYIFVDKYLPLELFDDIKLMY